MTSYPRLDEEKRNLIKYMIRHSTKQIKEIAWIFEVSAHTVSLLRKEVRADVHRPSGPPNAFSDMLDQLKSGRARPRHIPLKIDFPGAPDEVGNTP